MQIYLPAYRWVLENRLTAELDELRELHASQPLVLLDYETNEDVDNLATQSFMSRTRKGCSTL